MRQLVFAALAAPQRSWSCRRPDEAPRRAARAGASLAVLFCALASTASAQSVVGTFFPAQLRTVATSFYPTDDLAVGDLDNDGTDDVVAAVGMLTIGPSSQPFRGLLTNEDATPYAWCSPGVFPTYINGFRRTAIADFDEDGRRDVITLTFPFELVQNRNQGQGGTQQGFPNTQLVAPTFAPLLGLTFPNTLADPVAYVPIFLTGDFDRDGHADLLVGASLLHGMFGGVQNVTGAGLVFFFGHGDGTFAAPQHVPTPFEAPIDAEHVDWDNDGVPETILHLGQSVIVSGQTTSYQASLTLFDVAPGPLGVRSITVRGQPQSLGANTYTSLAYVPDTPTTGKILALAGHEILSPSQMRAALFVTEISPAGTVSSAPAAITPIFAATGNTDAQGIAAADFDRDGHLDLVALLEAENNTGLPYQPAEVVFVAGPFDLYGAHGAMGSLAIANSGAPTKNHPPMQPPGVYVFSPNRGCPDVLKVCDFDSDRAPDLALSNVLFTPPGGTSTQKGLVCIQNLAPSVLGQWVGRVDRLGHGTAGPSGRRARCGVRGNPLYGSSSFQIAVGNGPTAGLAMVVGAYLYNPQVPPPLGLDVAFWPEFWAPLQPLDASGWLLQPLLMPANPAVLSATSAVFQCLFFDANTGTLECSDAIRVSYGF